MYNEHNNNNNMQPYYNPQLPYRLDIDTCGIQLVSIHPRFTSYYAKLLENKTNHHIADGNSNIQATTTATTTTTATNAFTKITKRYKCLVYCTKSTYQQLLQYQQNNTVIVHYVQKYDPNLPKQFVTAVVFVEKTIKTKTTKVL